MWKFTRANATLKPAVGVCNYLKQPKVIRKSSASRDRHVVLASQVQVTFGLFRDTKNKFLCELKLRRSN